MTLILAQNHASRNLVLTYILIVTTVPVKHTYTSLEKLSTLSPSFIHS
jgi:hypothetical protein